MDCVDDHARWFAEFRDSDNYRRLQIRPIAYFSMEFALSEQFPFYAGGLGVLAADIIREASDQHLPMVAVGICYRDFLKVQPEQAGMTTVADRSGNPLVVSVPIQDRIVRVGAFRCDALSGVPVFFLTTEVEGNSPGDCSITGKLYPADKERRLQQEMILGIGGMRMLEALGFHSVVYHLNEGHSAMLALEIIQHEMRERLIGFTDALSLERHHVVFTNHTLLAAGNDVFSNDLVAANLARYAGEFTIPVHDIVKLGLVQESSLFSMTMLSMRLSSRINAVSRLHAWKAAEIWADHPMVPITNGIRVGTWDQIGVRNKEQGAREKMVKNHQENKMKLLDHIEKTTGKKWEDGVLLLGWGRRLVSYKRPLSMFADSRRFCSIVQREGRPVRLVMAGDVQPGDEESAKIAQELHRFVSSELKDCVAILPDYNTEVAGLMTAGCDVWLNTPIVGFEACGTSGMKACLNGVLPLSTRDGWIAEVELYKVGWPLDTDRVSESFYQTLEHEIAPMFFDPGRRAEWIEAMANARDLILTKFSTTRTLRAYIKRLYLPSIEESFST